MGAEVNNDLRDFERELDLAFRVQVTDRVAEAVRAGALVAGAALTMGTPVGNPSLWQGSAPPGYVGGTARRNWRASLNVPLEDTVDGVDQSGQATLNEQERVIAGFTWPGNMSIWITNNLPYILPLNDGWSTQAPAGFIEAAVRSAEDHINRTFR